MARVEAAETGLSKLSRNLRYFAESLQICASVTRAAPTPGTALAHYWHWLYTVTLWVHLPG